MVVGDQVVVETVEPPVVNVVGTHRTVTPNAVSVDVHDEDGLVLLFPVLVPVLAVVLVEMAVDE